MFRFIKWSTKVSTWILIICSSYFICGFWGYEIAEGMVSKFQGWAFMQGMNYEREFFIRTGHLSNGYPWGMTSNIIKKRDERLNKEVFCEHK